MKRNHDIVLEKYEIQHQRNESLEKLAIEKERLYNDMRIENDHLTDANYRLQRGTEELVNEKRILEGKLKNAEGNLKATQEEVRILRNANEK